MAKRRTAEPQGDEMPLSEHLRELRRRLASCAVLFAVSALAGLHFAPKLLDRLLAVGEQYGYHFIYIAPQELLLQYFGIALLLAVCVTLPLLGYQAWAFARPGLRSHENLLFLFAVSAGLLCFCAGVVFAVQVMLPFMLYFLSSLSGGSGVSAAVSVQNYMSFLMTVFLSFGAIFELPVISILLTQLGLLRVEWMRRGRRVILVVIFILAALITPPDVVSQIMVAIPMMALYELSILLCTVFQRFRKTTEQNQHRQND